MKISPKVKDFNADIEARFSRQQFPKDSEE